MERVPATNTAPPAPRPIEEINYALLAVEDLVARLALESPLPKPDLMREIYALGASAVPALIEFADNHDPEAPVTYQAVELLIALRDPAALPAIIRFYRTSDKDSVMSLEMSLPSFGPVLVPHLLPLLQDRSLDIYWRRTASAMAQTAAGRDETLRGEIADVQFEVLQRLVTSPDPRKSLTDDERNDLKNDIAFAALDLIALTREDARPLILAAFDAGIVDKMFLPRYMADRPVEAVYNEATESDLLDWYDEEYQTRLAPPSTPPRPTVAPRNVTPAFDVARQPYIAPPKTGRNDPCRCGNGKKYKKCHLGQPADRFS